MELAELIRPLPLAVLSLACTVVFLIFSMQPISPTLRRIGIALSVVTLTARLIRIELTDPLAPHDILEVPLTEALVTSIFFGILADEGALHLVLGGLAVTIAQVLLVRDVLRDRPRL